MPVRNHIAAIIAAGSLIAASGGAMAQSLDHGYPQNLELIQTNVFSNLPGQALKVDPDLVDAWGVAFVPNGAFWVNATGSGLALLYDGSGAKIPASFTVPAPTGSAGPSAPTGMVWNPSSGFLVPGTKLASVFIMSTLNGTITAWAGGLPTNPTVAVTAVDNSKAPSGASYTGLTFATTAHGAYLYAPNIATGRIDVFNASFAPANGELAGTFNDPAIPAGYTPFNVATINGTLVVTYARQNPSHSFVVPGAGAGYVSVFDTDGRLLRHVGLGGLLDAPWGIAEAPDGFGALSHKLLIGNFGDGHILAFSEDTETPRLALNQSGAPITIPGLWTLTFGGASKSDSRTLYFSAGPQAGTVGIVGSLASVTAPAP